MGKIRSRLGKSELALLALLILYVGLWPLEFSAPFVFSLRRFVQSLLYIVGGLALARWAIVGLRWAARRFLWRVRHRMAAVFFFVGALPVALGGLLAALGVWALFGALTAYTVTNRVELYAERLDAAAEALLWQLRSAPAEQRSDLLRSFAASAERQLPSLEVRTNMAGGEPAGPAGMAPIPDKLAGHFGPVRRGNENLLTALATNAAGDWVLLAVPLTPEYMKRILPDLGILAASFQDGTGGANSGFRTLFSPDRREAGRILSAGVIPPPSHPFDWQVGWPIQSPVLDWETNEIRGGVFLLRTRLSAVARTIFAGQSFSELALSLSYALLGAFCIAGLISLGVAVSLTRTLTGTVHDLYIGTQHVNRGDFSYRVPIAGADQISDLSRSFNAMTASIERLIEDSKERERLEAELDIAREVQAKLFPPEPPQLASLELLGVCRPARSVSGDFFDYVRLSGNRAAISFGDVSGKGISAALVMATLHSTVRTQLSLLSPVEPRQLERAAAELVDRTNKQLCQHTAENKFSTLFFSVYDEESGRLSYSNAGHLPPLLIRRGAVETLDVHGMVVGAFPFASYGCGAVAFEPGDLLVAFTDGVTETEDAYGQEFGERRLRELLLLHADRPAEEIIATVMTEVVEWAGDPTLQDDMTMLAARRI